ncbi:hypothetical protein BWQ96_00915 [Gracilariopsis chorda]|uniref:Reverse transcriptase domain-containing protein n=1 Tax=Gracilariopsis chorda TaxID=448386 RepID=A0A2V3J4G1_9FLOR|nr:hypothetical protein BWQ96_00915 [Gracilariopsis chorda]|eukprot:PXF49341.1 hypothetical protein BWQ96_00915 [Gracilariopsis chorda]
MVPPRLCTSRCHFYWLPLTAAYGPVDDSANWQQLSENLLRSLGFLQLVWVPQLFHRLQEDGLTCVAVKIVDDVLFAAPRHVIEHIISWIQQDFQLGTIVFAPGTFQFYGLTVTQYDDYSVTVHGDDKLQSFEPFPIDRNRHRQVDEPFNQLELRVFRSLNSSIGWLGIAASPFRAIASSSLQQKGPHVTVKHLVSQCNALRNLKKRRTCALFHRPPVGCYPVSLLVFADASRTFDHGQLGFVTGLMFGEITEGSVFHPISWSLHNSRRQVKPIGSEETLAAGEAIDEGKVLANAFRKLLAVKVDLFVVVDSKDLFDTLSTCRNATDRSIRAEVSVIRYEFETHNVSQIIWIPGKLNLADLLKKSDSPLRTSLEILLYSGTIPLDTTMCEHRISGRSTD